MESKTNYTVVGLTVVILLVGLLTAGLWLSVGFDNRKYDTYIVYMEEAVSGLSEDSLVKFNGVKVGSIDSIELNKADPQKVKILLNIEQGTLITTATEATLISQGITGSTYLGLSATSPTIVPLAKEPGQPYPVIPYKSSLLNQLEKTVTELSLSLKRLLNKNNTANLSKILSHLETITNLFANDQQHIDKALKDLPVLIGEMRKTLEHFTSMSNSVSSAGKQMSLTMKAGKNTIDKISQQAVPPAVVLLRRLDLIAANLEQVSVELRQNPSVILRGTAPAKPGPGE